MSRLAYGLLNAFAITLLAAGTTVLLIVVLAGPTGSTRGALLFAFWTCLLAGIGLLALLSDVDRTPVDEAELEQAMRRHPAGKGRS